MKLNKNNLIELSDNIRVPNYIREALTPSIVHIGVGGFHRAHQAFYLDELLNKGLTDWTICGMGIKPTDERIYTALKEQDYLYTLMVKHPNGAIHPRVIGSIVDYIFVLDNPVVAIEKLADPQTKVVSLTITEGGYNFDQTGEFMFDSHDIQWDIIHPEAPKTVFGLLTAALKIRKENNTPAFTILSCDNIQHNGNVARKMLLSFVSKVDAELFRWVETDVCFPNSMVDRITPVTTSQDIDLLQKKYNIEDASPVTCEPFIQWVMEDCFSNGRPAWEAVGVQFVNNIDPFEKMKIRLLNAGHSFLGFTGSLHGYQTINETVNDPLFRSCLRTFMDEEVTPILGTIEGVNLEEYKDNLLRRFANPNIKDQLTRICSESSAKLPKFLLPTIKEQLEKGGPIKYGVFMLAAWCRTLELYATPAYSYPIQDDMLEALTKAAVISVNKDSLAFISIEAIFGDLAKSTRYVEAYQKALSLVRTLEIKEALVKLSELNL
jgi:mannitol 2-dehydrogenase